MSVPSLPEVQATFAATLCDEWFERGLRDVVICPGSRSTPLALAAVRHGGFAIHVRLDERSASFFAVGRALASRTPVAIIVTSGTAAAELHAAVCEADLARVPLLVVTADRPPWLHGVGAPQTMDQQNLYGSAVRLFLDTGVADDAQRDTWRELAARSYAAAASQRGPVQVNVPLIEPLIAEPHTLPASLAETDIDQSRPDLSLDIVGQRVLAIAGTGTPASLVTFLSSHGVVVIGDATTPHTVPYFDTLLRSESFAHAARPDLVIRVGGLPASKVLGQRLQQWQVPVIALEIDGPVADPDRVVTQTVSGQWREPSGSDADAWNADAAYLEWWSAIVVRYEQQVLGLDFAAGALTETSAARAVVRHVNGGHRPLFVGSSMPIREVEWFTPSRTQKVFSNRGVNGIDGVVSSAFGANDGRGVVAMVGDLTFAHDVSAWVDVPASGPVSVVVFDNGGGHIFDFLPQKSLLDEETFTTLFTTPRSLNLEAFASAVGARYHEVTTVGELDAALAEDVANAAVSIIRARVNTTVSSTDFHAWLHRSSARIVAEFLP